MARDRMAVCSLIFCFGVVCAIRVLESRNGHIFSAKGQRVSIFGFGLYCDYCTQFHSCSTKAAKDNS